MRSRVKNYLAEYKIFLERSIAGGIIVVVLLLVVVGRLFYLQVLKYDYYSTLSQGNRIRIEPVGAASRVDPRSKRGPYSPTTSLRLNLELVREQVATIKAVDSTLAQLVDIGVLRLTMSAASRAILSHKAYRAYPSSCYWTSRRMARFAFIATSFGCRYPRSLARHYPSTRWAVMPSAT